MKENGIPRRRRVVGLGLFIVRSIVEAHGGTVALTSEADERTAVTVVVPRRPAA